MKLLAVLLCALPAFSILAQNEAPAILQLREAYRSGETEYLVVATADQLPSGQDAYLVVAGAQQWGPFDGYKYIVNFGEPALFVWNDGKGFLLIDKQLAGPFENTRALLAYRRTPQGALRFSFLCQSDEGQSIRFYGFANAVLKMEREMLLDKNVREAYVSPQEDVALLISESREKGIYMRVNDQDYPALSQIEFLGWAASGKKTVPFYYGYKQTSRALVIFKGKKLIASGGYFTMSHRDPDSGEMAFVHSSDDGEKVYTLNESWGPYDEVSDLEYRKGWIFNYRRGNRTFHKSEGKDVPLKSSDHFRQLYYRNSDTILQGIKDEAGNISVDLNGSILFSKPAKELAFLEWSATHGPVFLVREADSFRLYQDYRFSSAYQEIVARKENQKGSVALLVLINHQIHLLIDDQPPAVFSAIYNFDQQEEQFIAVNSIGEFITVLRKEKKKLIRIGAREMEIPYNSRVSYMDSAGIVAVLFSNPNTCAVNIVRPDPELLSNQLSGKRRLTDTSPGNPLQALTLAETSNKPGLTTCSYVHWKGKEYGPFNTIREMKGINEDALLLREIDPSWIDHDIVICNGEIYYGKMTGNTLQYLEGGQLKILEMKP